MIECVDVHKSYRLGHGEVVALRGIDLSITEPGFYAIMGHSGSGKSTLLHLLAALDRPDRGTISIGGKHTHELGDREATEFRRRGVGIIFQQFNLIPTLTATENVELPGMLAGENQSWLRARASDLLGELGLAERADHRPEALSGGEQQRVAIARSLLYSPPVVLADEPTGALDSVNAEKLWRLLGRVASEKRVVVVMVTHEPSAAAHCRETWVLRDGRVVGRIESEGLDASGVAARYQQLVGT
ncbi:MAG: ABC transporter ATP-binding protein [Phycisphaeraceae bacterium]|nr:ABC transporter ATP-binding protein [Phycisphaeraceae bacterium]